VALGAGAVLEVGVLVAAVQLPGGWLRPAVFLTGMLVAALGLGLYVATHRAYVAGLHDRARALERERDQQAELAAAAERARIARDMHDVVAHHLTVMVALSDGAAVAGPDRAADAMRMVSETGRRALAETRRVVGVLRSPAPEAAATRRPAPGIGELELLVGTVRSAGLPTTLAVTGPAAELPAGVQLAAYRVVQEALTNSLKHAGAGARAAVRLDSTSAEQLLLEVTDDGGGPAGADDGRGTAGANDGRGTAGANDGGRPAGADHGGGPAGAGIGAGSGLVGIRERVLACGGEVSAGPGAAGGWRVAARLRAAP
jgi:signal transduction histidine kinase